MKRLALALLLSAAPVGQAAAQHALVLSGGGGRGLAHAGAVVALEELGYEVPLVVGTSMGAIIGSLYAAGYDAVEIRRIIGEENWLERFAAVPLAVGPDRSVRRPLLRFGLGTRRLPEGLLPATGVNRRLVELLFDAGARAGGDFDRLPRRFRAVTADLATGEEVVLAAGDLPRAVRASMAVPGVFAPVTWGERILVDGGVANNVPISVARKAAALPVIAVDVLRPQLELPERGALDVGVRGLRLLIENALPVPTEAADIVVLPRVAPGFSEAWFPADPTPLMQAGYDAVREQVRPLEQRPPSVRREAAAPPRTVAGVSVHGGDPALRRLVQRVLEPAVGAYDADDIVARTSALYHTGLFDGIWPRTETDDAGDGAVALVVDVVPVNRSSAALAARWDDDLGGTAWLSLRHLLSLREPVELRAATRLNELHYNASGEASIYSVLFPGLAWTGGTHASLHRVRVFAADTMLRRDDVRRAGAWLGAELHRGWIASLLVRSDYIDDVEADRAGWSTGPFLRFSRLPPPDAVSTAEPLLEVEARTGDIRYSRFHARAGGERAIDALAGARVGAYVDVADASADTPRDALPAATRELAPWLLTGQLRASSRATLAVDLALPFVLNGFVRLRSRGFAAGADLLDFREPRAWLAGGEVGGIWPTVAGTVEVGAARGGGSGGWRFNIAVGPRF